MAAGATSRIGVGSFVINVMNRHPAVVARMTSTLQIASGGRFMLGIGIGGHPKEHAAYGIDFPAPPERVARLEEAVAVIRALWTGGPVTRDVGVLSVGRRGGISRAGSGPADHRRRRDRGRGTAGRADRRRLVRVRRQLRDEPAALPGVAGRPGRRREDQRVLVGFQGDWLGDESIADSPWVTAPRETWLRWQAAGADGAIVLARTTEDVDALVEAAERW